MTGPKQHSNLRSRKANKYKVLYFAKQVSKHSEAPCTVAIGTNPAGSRDGLGLIQLLFGYGDN